MIEMDAATYARITGDKVTGIVALLEIQTDPVIRYVLMSRDLNYQPAEASSALLWRGEPNITWSNVEASLLLKNPVFELTIQNVFDPVANQDVPWSRVFSVSHLNGVKAGIEIVALDLDDPFGVNPTRLRKFPTTYRISGARIEGPTLVLPVGPPHNLLKLETPGISIMGNRCRWNSPPFHYKGPECGSVSPLPTCGGTIPDCILRHALILRFSQPVDPSRT